MPELPEVENFARSLNERFAGAEVAQLTFHRGDLRFPFDKRGLGNIAHSGAKLCRIFRVGKQICFEFDSGRIFASLGMSGSFVESDVARPLLHEHVTFAFRNRRSGLGFVDPRRFGFFSLVPPPESASPLDSEMTFSVLADLKRRGCRRRLRDVLMDQSLIAGVGNIYMCEACFAARVSPLDPLHAVTGPALRRLSKSLVGILERAIELGGSSIASYRKMDGSRGGAQDMHKVYGRAGESCPRSSCRGTIRRVEAGGRGTFLCPSCQRAATRSAVVL